MGQKFEKAMLTKDFVYYMDYSEGDDNGSVKMYRRATGELVSDNYRANQDMYENIMYYNYEWLSETLLYARRCIVEEHKIGLARDFFLENKFPGKIANISFDGIQGALNQALRSNLGFTLSINELKTVHGLVKEKKQKMGKHM